MIEDQDIRLIALRPSRLLATVFSLGIAATLGGIVFISETAMVSIPLCTGIVVLYVWHMRRILLWSQHSIIGFALYEAKDLKETVQKILLKQRDGNLQEARIMPHGFVSAWMTCVKYQYCEGKWIKRFPRTLLLMADSLDTEAFRRIRVDLKWG